MKEGGRRLGTWDSLGAAPVAFRDCPVVMVEVLTRSGKKFSMVTFDELERGSGWFSQEGAAGSIARPSGYLDLFRGWDHHSSRRGNLPALTPRAICLTSALKSLLSIQSK